MFLHAVHPLFWISLVVIAAGAAAFREKKPGARPAAWFFVLAGVFLFVLTGWPLVFGPSAAVAAIRNADADRIVAFEIGPVLGQPAYGDLVQQTVRVTDRAKIRRLVELLSASNHAAPNHPKGGWDTLLSLDDGKEKHQAIIRSTSDGLLIQIGGGGVGRDFRNQELKEFLEEVAGVKK
ncbi:MAG: hypothetical protein K8T20_16385 [Planctomycetes bacterium]|nr:hypothetical protein [Planctomycetota bacterium]